MDIVGGPASCAAGRERLPRAWSLSEPLCALGLTRLGELDEAGGSAAAPDCLARGAGGGFDIRASMRAVSRMSSEPSLSRSNCEKSASKSSTLAIAP